MEKLMEILREIDDTIDFEKETALIDGRILDSFGMIRSALRKWCRKTLILYRRCGKW